jgi:hypothetical protein
LPDVTRLPLASIATQSSLLAQEIELNEVEPSTRTGAAHVNLDPAVGVLGRLGVGNGVGVDAIGDGVALGWKEDCAFCPDEPPHAARINTTARTATLM